MLPSAVKRSPSINSFKANLDSYKAKCLADEYYAKVGNFWDVSEHVLSRIETPSYLSGRQAFADYLDNPWIAKRKQININKSI